MITKVNDHVNATPIVRDAWRQLWGREGTPNEILYSQAIASLETGYGRIGQFGTLASRGQFNWGSEQRQVSADGTCPVGFALGTDQGKVCFFVFPSDVEAAAAFLKTLTKSSLRPDTVAAMAGSPEDVAKAMRGTAPPRTAYYAGVSGTEEQRIQAYADGIRTRAKQIGIALKDAPLASPTQPDEKGSSAIVYAGLILSMAGSAWMITRKPKGTK